MATEDPLAADQDLLERLLFVFPELRGSFNTTNTASTGVMIDRQSGVLWKRRDVFKNRWRPRWFALNPGQGILTYYLLNASTTPSASMTPTSQFSNGSNRGTPRTRSPSWDSQVSGVSESSLDYDVVPRGTIFLLGCTVAPNESLSRPTENLYVFTIRPPQASESHIHLAARSIPVRDQWIEKISKVCQRRNTTPPRLSHSLPNNLPTPRRELYNREQSIPEHEVLTQDDRIWETLGNNVTVDLSKKLSEQIQQKIDKFLPMCHEFESSSRWSILTKSSDIDVAAQTPDDKGRSIVLSRKLFRQTPMHIFSLLIDISRRHLYESNVQADERVKVLNSHTFLDFYSYKAVWPTSSREFAVCTHWRIVQRNDRKRPSLLMVSFSCDESNSIRPVEESHVRGTAIISLVLLEPVEPSGCIATRIVSVDLGGGMSLHLSNIIASQQANLPTVVENYLERNEPETPNVFKLPLTQENVMKHVVSKVAHLTSNGKVTNSNDPIGDSFAVDANASIKTSMLTNEPSLELQAMFLLFPVILHKITVKWSVRGSSLLFLLSAYLVARHLVARRVGQHVGHAAVAIESATCRFQVDAKGLRRLVTNKREEREELDLGTAEILPIHVIMAALARALSKTSRICRRRVRYPWLMIDRVVDTYKGFVDVTIVEKDKSLTVQRVTTKSMEEIAEDFAAAKTSLKFGQCLLVPLESSEQSQALVDAMIAKESSVVVLAVVGGLQNVDGNPTKKGEIPFLRSHGAQRNVSISLTIKSCSESLVHDAEQLARQTEKLVQFPEICEDSLS